MGDEWTVDIPHKLNVSVSFCWCMGWALMVISPDGSWLITMGFCGTGSLGSLV